MSLPSYIIPVMPSQVDSTTFELALFRIRPYFLFLDINNSMCYNEFGFNFFFFFYQNNAYSLDSGTNLNWSGWMFEYFSIRWHFVIAKNVGRLINVVLKINQQQSAGPDVYTPKWCGVRVHHSTVRYGEIYIEKKNQN